MASLINQAIPTTTPIMPQHRQRVTFSDASEMVLVTNLAQTDAKDKIWFTSEELDSFEANMSCYVKMVRLHISKRHAPMASNILGLEKFLTVQLTGEYKGRRSKLTKDVVGEDAWHRSPACASVPENEIVERLARISAENSKWARERARAAAMFLEQDQESECLAEERLLPSVSSSHW